MKIKTTKLSTGLIVALLNFTVGVAVALLWLSPRFRSVSSLSASKVIDTAKEEKLSLPDGLKEVVVKNKITLLVPQDMKPSELIGDSLSYREAYNNLDLNITIVYGKPTRCDTPNFLLERPTYHESIINVDGRKAKLSIDSLHQPEFITARLCFLDVDNSGMRLNVAVICKDERALEIAQQIFTSIKFKDNK